MGRVAIPMEDGGEVVYEDAARIIPIGNGRGVPEKFSYVHPGGPDQPSFRFEFGVMKRIPVCIGVHLEAKDGVPVRTRDLKVSHIDKVVISAVGAVAFQSRPSRKPGHTSWFKPHGDKRFNADSVEVARASVKGKPRGRRAAEDVDLQLVADTWRDAPPGSKTQALITVFFCSRATAARYKKRAVEAGLLDG